MSSREYHHRTHHHWREHGLTCEEFDALLDRAQRQCELCGIDPAPIVGSNGRITTGLLIDHEHKFGVVRGLLCSRCNAHMRFVDSGERPVDDRTAAYMALSSSECAA